MRKEPNLITEPASKVNSFTEICLGLMLDPKITLQKLYTSDPPPYLLRILLVILLLVFGPIAFLFLKYDFLATRINVVLIFNILLMITAAFYILLESVLLFFYKVEIPILKIFASFCYGLVPIIPLLILCYILDLLLTGRFSVSTYVITGMPDPESAILTNFVYAHLIAKILFLIILYNSLRILNNLSFADALFVTLLSSVPFYLAYYIAINIAGYLSPEAITGVQGLLHNSLDTILKIFQRS